jgi:hypothetical protein
MSLSITTFALAGGGRRGRGALQAAAHTPKITVMKSDRTKHARKQ